MSSFYTDWVKCGYCGCFHTYSAEMCKDMANRPTVWVYTDAEVRKRELAAYLVGVKDGEGIEEANMEHFKAKGLRLYGGKAVAPVRDLGDPIREEEEA